MPRGKPLLTKCPEILTRRKTEVLQLVVAGKTNEEIGAALAISANTVAAHIDAVYDRLRLGSDVTRTQLAEIARERGLVEPAKKDEGAP